MCHYCIIATTHQIEFNEVVIVPNGTEIFAIKSSRRIVRLYKLQIMCSGS